MPVDDQTRTTVERYFVAWTTKDVAQAYALLADDLRFSGPTASYATAEAFRPALVAFANMTSGARIVQLLTEGDRAAMLYDCELPPPVGTLRIASFFRVEHGKIPEYETQFDATELRKLLTSRPSAQ